MELVPLALFILTGVLFWVAGRSTRMDLATDAQMAAAEIE